jgi:hypothetical protein
VNRAELVKRMEAGEAFEFLPFWKGPLSQWARTDFKIDGVKYITAEHWMMAEKARTFGDDETLRLILKSGSPKEAKALGREVKNYNDEKWASVRFEAVIRGNVAKFSPADRRLILLDTGNKVLVEASPEDRIWGIGLTEDHPNVHVPSRWPGQNLLGFALMEARKRLQ